MRIFVHRPYFLIAGWIIVVLGLWGYISKAFAFTDPQQKAKGLAAYALGVIYDLQGDSEKSIVQFQESLSYDDNFAAHLRLGAHYARQGELEPAIAELQKVLDVDEDNVQARYLLALIYSTQKDFDKAALEYEHILKSFSKAEPENLEIYGYLGQLYYSLKQYDKAIKQFEIILSLDPTNVDVLYILGSLQIENRNRPKATELFARALKINPQHDGCLNSLGYLYAEDGVKLDEAQSLIEQALKADPDNGAYLDSLGWVFYQKGQYEHALNLLQQADNTLKDPLIYEHIGDVYFKMQKTEDAKKFWTLSLELRPDQEKVKQKLHATQ